jgi:hypothetical protein
MMILGRGLLASIFRDTYSDDNKYIIFASGVSNSKELDTKEFDREVKLFSSLDINKMHIVYFSSCAIYDLSLQNSPYIQHKLKMEKLVSSSPFFTIFRLPQLVGKTSNKFTLVNYIYYKILQDESFQLWVNARRNFLDIDDAYLAMDYIIKNELGVNEVINVASPNSSHVSELVTIFEDVLNKKAKYIKADTTSSYEIDISFCKNIFSVLNVNFPSNYLNLTIKKYFCFDGNSE